MIASFNSQGPSKRELSQAREISQSSSLPVLKDILWLVKEIQKNLGTPWALRGISCLIHHYSFWLNSSKTFPWPSFLSHDLNLCSQNPDINLYHSTNYLLISWMPFPWLYSVLLEWTDYASLVFIVFPLINIINRFSKNLLQLHLTYLSTLFEDRVCIWSIFYNCYLTQMLAHSQERLAEQVNE